MDLEFCTPAEAAALMKCTENFLRTQAYEGKIPHVLWSMDKLVFTSDHIREIARIRTQAVRADSPAATAEQLHAASPSSVRQIGTRARGSRRSQAVSA